MEKLTSQELAALRTQINELETVQLFLKAIQKHLFYSNAPEDLYFESLNCFDIVENNLETLNTLLNEQ
jgi:hypothetical protein